MLQPLIRRRLLRAGGSPAALIAALPAGAIRVSIGDHRLAATARSARDLQRWHGRLVQALPDFRFELARLQLAGPPWATVAVLDWHGSGVDAEGLPVRHRGLHLLRFAWGRLVAVEAFAHATLLESTLEPARATTADDAAPALAGLPWPA